MKTIKLNFLFIIMAMVTLSSCESKEDVKIDIDDLRKQRISLQSEVQNLQNSYVSKQNQISVLNEELKVLHIYKSGGTPKYILKLKLKQSHFSFSIKEHMKDEMNAVDFELPVDEEFYRSVSVGTEIVDDFRVGSFLLRGSYGDWEMTVTGKEIR